MHEDLNYYQALMAKWHEHNFPEEGASIKLNLLTEELGELAAAFVKGEAGIKGTPEYWRQKEKDAVGDLLLTLLTYCHIRDLDVQKCLELAWAEISARDYQKYPVTGKAPKKPRGQDEDDYWEGHMDGN